MRPVRIEMAGFGAFREPAVADLRHLDLVALVGATGSGKSTIIDAITFALYGSIARYQNASLLEPAINAQSAEARVRVDFEVGAKSYTATRAVRRTRNGAETREVRLECGEEVLAANKREMDEAVPALLGLGFEQFNKTVVLPQGAFARFLHDRPAERQELLRNLLGLDLYLKVGQRARARSTDAANRAAIIREEIDKAGPVTEEDLRSLGDRVQVLARRAGEARVATESLAALRTDMHVMEATRGQLNVRLGALASVRPAAGLARLAERAVSARAAHDEARAALDAARTARDVVKASVAEAPDVGASRRILDRFDSLDAAILNRTRRQTDAEVARHVAQRAEMAFADVLATEKALSESVDVAVAQRGEAVAARDGGPDAVRLERELEALIRHGELAVLVVAAERALEQLRGSAAEADAGLVSANAVRNEARSKLERAERAGGAAALTAALEVGQACPVCRQLVSVVPDHDVAAELRAAHGEVRHAEAALSVANMNATQARVDLSTTEHGLARDRQAVEALASQLSDRDEVTLRAARALAVELAAAAEAAANVEREARSTLTDHQRSTTFRQASEARDAARQGAALDEAALTAAQTNVTEAEAALIGAPQRPVVEADLRRATELADALAKADAASLDAERSLDVAIEAMRAVEADEAAFQRGFDSQRDAVAAQGPPPRAASLVAGWAELETWAASLATQTADELDQLHRALAANADAAQALSAALEDLADGLGTTGEPLERVVAAHARADAALEIAQARRVSQTERRLEAADLDDVALVARRLGQHLDARGFESWLLDEAVADLAHKATERLLALSAQRYSLVSDGTDFRVRDHHNADQTRDAKSLSGGETFLASLSLALALADNIAELAPDGAPRLGSIFLDEGFGTLDPDTLDLVASAIEELGSQGRMVGIVTHIRDLADRMPVRLEVRAGPSGSTIERIET